MDRSPASSIYILAGVNGAGKSSVGGELFRNGNADYFNPDEAARRIQSIHPRVALADANAQAWQLGRSTLERAIAEKFSFAFETTLGGNTIPRILEQAALSGCRVQMWFAGLKSAELHIRRVAARVARGGHPIPEAKIRERWDRSRENLIKLLPVLDELRVFDNSEEAPPETNRKPVPLLVLEMRRQKITAPADLSHAPDWAKPIVTAAMKMHLK